MLRDSEHPHAGDQNQEQPERRAGPGQGDDEERDQHDERQPLPVEQRVGEHVAGAEAAARLARCASSVRPMWKTHMAISGTPTTTPAARASQTRSVVVAR